MASPLPLDPHGALRKAAARQTRDPFPWGQLLLVLILVGAGGWGFFHYYWQYRTPQHRVLVDRDGQTMDAMILERHNGLLRISLPGKDATQLFPISFLSEADQAFFAKAPFGSPISFPLRYPLKDEAGNSRLVTLNGQNEYFVRYSVDGDPDSHEVALADLPEFDRAVIKALPNSVKLVFPLDCTLTDINEVKFRVHLTGRSNAVITYSLADDPNTWAIEQIKNLSENDKIVVGTLPVTFEDRFPLDWRLPLQPGTKQQPVKLIGESVNFVRYQLPDEGESHFLHYYSLAAMTAEERDYLKNMAQDSADTFPLDCALTDKNGRVLEVNLKGRSNLEVKFVSHDDNKTYDYPLANLSGPDQAFVKGLPKTILDASELPEIPIVVQAMRKQFVDLQSKIADLQNEESEPAIQASSTKEDLDREIANAQTLLVSIAVSIDNEYVKRINELQKANIDLEGEQASTSLSDVEKITTRNKIDKNNFDITALKTQLSSFDTEKGLTAKQADFHGNN